MALQHIFAKYYRPLTIYAFKYIDDQKAAEDIVQEVIVRFWETKKYRDVRGALKNYLFTSVRNRSINHLESFHHAKKEYLDTLDHNFFTEQFLDEEINEQNERLTKALAELPEKMRQVLQLIIFENKAQNEVALELDISLNTVKTQYARAKVKLRSSMKLIVLVIVMH